MILLIITAGNVGTVRRVEGFVGFRAYTKLLLADARMVLILLSIAMPEPEVSSIPSYITFSFILSIKLGSEVFDNVLFSFRI